MDDDCDGDDDDGDVRAVDDDEVQLSELIISDVDVCDDEGEEEVERAENSENWNHCRGGV